MKTNDLYPTWRKELIDEQRLAITASERALQGFKDQTSIYARSIAEVADMHRKALAVYENSPKTLE